MSQERLVALFVTDGALRANGTWGPSEFDYATGDCYEGRLKQFERDTGSLLCEIDRKQILKELI